MSEIETQQTDDRQPDDRQPNDRRRYIEMEKMMMMEKGDMKFIHFPTPNKLYDALLDPLSEIAILARDGKILSFCCSGNGVAVNHKTALDWVIDHIDYVPNDIQEGVASHLRSLGYTIRSYDNSTV